MKAFPRTIKTFPRTVKAFPRTVTFILAVSLLTAAAVIPQAAPLKAHAISLQEQSWVSHLRPAALPKPIGSTSYPAELIVAASTQQEIKLTGTCALEGQLTDEDVLKALKQAAAESGYKSPENAVDDKLKIASLRDKVTFNEAEKNRIIGNWLALVGMDKVADMLKGQLPKYDGADAVGAVVDMISSGNLPDASSLSPVPTNVSGFTQGLIINGVKISYEQYQRDREKYKNIVELANARARFREFNYRLNSIIRSETAGKTAWTIRIQTQTIKDQLYRTAPDVTVPYFYTADVVLTKKDGNFETPAGTYQGDFKLDIDVSLEDYDRNYAKELAGYLNDELKKSAAHIPDSMLWKVVSHNVNKTSENKATLEGKNVYVTLGGSLGGVYELRLDTMALDVTCQKVLHDFVCVLKQEGEGATHTMTWTEITDSEAGTSYPQDHSVIVDRQGTVTETDNTDDEPFPNVDVRTYLKLTLVVDACEI